MSVVFRPLNVKDAVGEYSCDHCKSVSVVESSKYPEGWKRVEGHDVCGKCCKIMRAFVNKEV